MPNCVPFDYVTNIAMFLFSSVSGIWYLNQEIEFFIKFSLLIFCLDLSSFISKIGVSNSGGISGREEQHAVSGGISGRKEQHAVSVSVSYNFKIPLHTIPDDKVKYN